MSTQFDVREPKQLVHLSLDWSLINRLEEFRAKKKMENRTVTISYLLDTALKMIAKIEGVPKDQLSSQLEEARAQLKHGGLVDYASTLSARDLKILHSIISDEYQARGMK